MTLATVPGVSTGELAISADLATEWPTTGQLAIGSSGVADLAFVAGELAIPDELAIDLATDTGELATPR